MLLYQIIVVIHIMLGLGIVGLVLMQHGKGADAGAAFGGGASGSVFGAQGAASFLSRTTAIFATLFFTTSLILAILSGQQSKKADIVETLETSQENPTPVVSDDVPLPAPLTLPEAQAIKEIEQPAKP